MHRTLRPCLLLLATLLFAADPSWRSKPVSKWDADDAKQVLANSPWARQAQPHWLPDLSSGQREAGGNLNEGVGKGVELAGTGLIGSRRQAEAIKQAHTKPEPLPVMVRWESALPVRTAERLAGDTSAPTLDSDDYAIAIYGMPTPKRGNQADLLKEAAALRRSHKKDMKPSRVEILRHDEDDETATLVYLFPRSVHTGEMLRGEPQILMPTEGQH